VVVQLDALDNPVWTSLTTGHRSIARLNGRAGRYANDVSPLAGLEAPTAAAFADLSALVAPEEGVGLCSADPSEAPPDWQVIRTRPLEQMVCTRFEPAPASPPLELGEADLPEMLTLTAATEPGPFVAGTIRMGRYFGIRSETGRLIAMAGERLKPQGFIEISAVCTDPEFRGRGHAKALLNFLVALIFAEGKIPFLHVKSENGAMALYSALGFEVRRTMHLTVIVRR
jgi:ribosomal protein S18 acetylase RimI-like enzyme